MKMRHLSRRLFQVLPTASARRERPVTSTPPGGSALLVVSLLALKVIATGSNNWYDHTVLLGRHLSSSSRVQPGSLESTGALRHRTICPPPISRTNYQLVWSDEFNGTSVDASKWNKVGPWGAPDCLEMGQFQLSQVECFGGQRLGYDHGPEYWRKSRWHLDWRSSQQSRDGAARPRRFSMDSLEALVKLPPIWTWLLGQAIWLVGDNSADET